MVTEPTDKWIVPAYHKEPPAPPEPVKLSRWQRVRAWLRNFKFMEIEK